MSFGVHQPSTGRALRTSPVSTGFGALQSPAWWRFTSVPQRWLPRCRPLLHSLRLPDHSASARRARRSGTTRPRKLLEARRGAYCQHYSWYSQPSLSTPGSTPAPTNSSASARAASPHCSTSPTGSSLRPATATGTCSLRRRHSTTSGAWRSRSSSTSYGRFCSCHSQNNPVVGPWPGFPPWRPF